MVEGLHVMSRRVLQLLNQSSVWGRCFQIFLKNLGVHYIPTCAATHFVGFDETSRIIFKLGKQHPGYKTLIIERVTHSSPQNMISIIDALGTSPRLHSQCMSSILYRRPLNSGIQWVRFYFLLL